MSSVLLRKALLLEDVNPGHGSSQRKKDTEISGKKDVDKHSQKLKRKHQKNSLQQMKKSKTLKDDYWSYKDVDNTDLNLRMISKISELDDAQPQLVDKITKHKKGRSRQEGQQEKTECTQQSIFSDRDFDKFQEEYDFDFWGK